MSDDVFKSVHQLLRAKMRFEALDLVYDEVEDRLKTPYDSDPNHAWYVVGDIYFKLGEVKKAIAAFELSVEFETTDTEALMALANAYSLSEDHVSSENTLRKALKMDPQDESIAYNLANALFDQEKYSEAIKFYRCVKSNNEELSKLAEENLCLAQQRETDSR